MHNCQRLHVCCCMQAPDSASVSRVETTQQHGNKYHQHQTMSDSSESREPPPAPLDISDLWSVQDVLAERVTLTGDREILVAWRPSWIPIGNMEETGPIMRKFRKAPRCTFEAAVGTIVLPVEAGTTLADDCATVAAYAEQEVAEFRARYDAEISGAGNPAVQQRHRETPRKSLGLVAKRASHSKIHKAKKYRKVVQKATTAPHAQPGATATASEV